MNELSFRDTLGSAIRYWEIRRLAYNAVLAAVVIFFFVVALPGSLERLTFDLALGLFVLAVLANVAYCAAYVVDVFAQLSSARETWLRVRWVLFVVGLLFAIVITYYVAAGMFGTAV